MHLLWCLKIIISIIMIHISIFAVIPEVFGINHKKFIKYTCVRPNSLHPSIVPEPTVSSLSCMVKCAKYDVDTVTLVNKENGGITCSCVQGVDYVVMGNCSDLRATVTIYGNVQHTAYQCYYWVNLPESRYCLLHDTSGQAEFSYDGCAHYCDVNGWDMAEANSTQDLETVRSIKGITPMFLLSAKYNVTVGEYFWRTSGRRVAPDLWYNSSTNPQPADPLYNQCVSTVPTVPYLFDAYCNLTRNCLCMNKAV